MDLRKKKEPNGEKQILTKETRCDSQLREKNKLGLHPVSTQKGGCRGKENNVGRVLESS